MWLREYRESAKLELDEFARVVNTYRRLAKMPVNGIVSNTLVHILEVDDRTVTHPNLANAIAAVCGATPEQRDSIVAEEYRGTWTPGANDKQLVNKAIWKVTGKIPSDMDVSMMVKQTANKQTNYMANHSCIQFRTIAKVDMYGHIIETYDTVKKASIANNIGEKFIRNRCKRNVKDTPPSGIKPMFTFRYLDEWDKMTREQRLADLT